MTAISVAYVAPNAGRGAPSKPVTTGLVMDMWNSIEYTKQWLGHSFIAGAIRDHDHDGLNSAGIPIGPNLLRNGSFESDLTGWTATPFTGGSVVSSTTHLHGTKSLQITSTVLANGGGKVESNEFIAIDEKRDIHWSFLLDTTGAANISSRVEILWYNWAKGAISATNLVDLTDTPTAHRLYQGNVSPPNLARFMKLRCTGGVPGVGSATGTVTFDGIILAIARYVALLEELVASSSAQLDFTKLDHGYPTYEFVITDLNPVTTNATLNVRVDRGAGFVTTSTYGSVDANAAAGSTLATSWIMTFDLHNSGARGSGGVLRLLDARHASDIYRHAHSISVETPGADVEGFRQMLRGHVHLGTGGPITGVRFFMSSGNISRATIRMFGVG